MRITANSLALVLLPAVGALACAQQGGEQAAGEMEMAMGFDLTEVRAAIAEGQAQFLAGVEAGDAAAMAALFTEDGTVFPPNAEAVKGKAAIQEFWAAFLAEGVENLTVNTLEVGGGGDVAYEVGEYSLTISGEGGESITDRGRYVVIFKRGTDGAWMVHADMWNSDLPLE